MFNVFRVADSKKNKLSIEQRGLSNLFLVTIQPSFSFCKEYLASSYSLINHNAQCYGKHKHYDDGKQDIDNDNNANKKNCHSNNQEAVV